MLSIGHHTHTDASTGCTVVLGPFRGACDVRGMATGTRELDVLRPGHIAQRIDAILLTGGSAFGLAAADGVMRWHRERGLGFETGAARVPIVPAAVVYDLAVGRADVWPDAAMGYAACDAARTGEPAEGAVGAGTGCTVGKVLGAASADRGGFGYAAGTLGDTRLAALAVVNAVGDVLGEDGRIVAGSRRPDGSFADSARLLREGEGGGPALGANTTLVVVATDAPLDRVALQALAQAGSTGMTRRIRPVHTLFDGDVVFAVSTAEQPSPLSPARLLALSELASELVGVAIERAVTV